MEAYTETPAQQAMRKAFGRACMAASHDRFAEVVTVLEEAIRVYGDSPDAWLCQAYRELSEAAAMVGDTEKGLTTAQRALAIRTQIGFSDNPTVAKCEAAHIYRRLALNHFLRKEPQETFQALENCRRARFFSRRQDWSYRPNSAIYTPSVLEAISNCGVATEQILAEAQQVPGTRLRRYPDGTVQFDGPGEEVFAERAFEYARFMETELRGGGELDLKARRRLFTTHVDREALRDGPCMIYAWGEWAAKYGNEDSFHIRAWPFADLNRVDRKQMPVVIVFKQRLSREAPSKLMKTLLDWANSVRDQGIFGEGPMGLVEPTATFFAKAAQFSIDASASGPQTLLWLVLSLLSFCSVAIITDVWFAPLRDVMAHYGVPGQQRVFVPLPNPSGA